MKIRTKVKSLLTSVVATIAETFTVSGKAATQANLSTANEVFGHTAVLAKEPLRRPYGLMEKRPLQRDVPPGTEFPALALGKTLGEAAIAIQEAVQAPMGICGASVLAAAALAAQAHVNVVIDEREHPVSEFFITVGGTGERKTAVDNIALREVRAHVKRLRKQHAAAAAEYDIAADAYARIKSEALANKGNLDERVRAGTECGSPPSRPLDPKILMADLTIEGLLKSLLNGQPSQGVFADEAAQVLGGHAMKPDTVAKTLAQLSNLWDGKDIEVTRATSPDITISGKRCSMHLMAQPGVSKMLVANDIAADQGFLSRCLATWPESTVGTRLYENSRNNREALDRFNSRLRLLLEREPTFEDEVANSPRSPLKPRQLTCSEEAKQVYIAFHDDIERSMAGGLKELRAFANKAPEHLLRLAGILEVVENPDATAISQANAINARELVRYFLGEAHRLNESGKQNPELNSAQKLLDYFKRENRPLSLVEIYQLGPSDVRSAGRARYIANILVEHGQIEPISGIRFDGKVRREGFRLRP
ncbi:MAG TPA: YfjI family protein [Steroidobacteraceae bacterium]|jgi:hypothetical protein